MPKLCVLDCHTCWRDLKAWPRYYKWTIFSMAVLALNFDLDLWKVELLSTIEKKIVDNLFPSRPAENSRGFLVVSNLAVVSRSPRQLQRVAGVHCLGSRQSASHPDYENQQLDGVNLTYKEGLAGHSGQTTETTGGHRSPHNWCCCCQWCQQTGETSKPQSSLFSAW